MEMVSVTFKKNYIASRGPGIAGHKGQTKFLRMSEALQELIETGIVEVVRATPAQTRKKATGKKGAATA